MPCCCPATLSASTDGDPATAQAASNASHQQRGSCSDRGGVVVGCGAEPRAITDPVSRLRTSTFVLWVDESTPATSRTVRTDPERGRRAVHQTCTNRSWPAMIALMQSTLPYLDADELFRLVPLPDALGALRSCFAAAPVHVDRVHTTACGGELLVMPAAAGDAAGVKLVGIQPANPTRGLPIIQGVYVLFDMRIGQAVALMDGAALTTLRTPMISALATDALARQDVSSVGIIGTGPQAVAHVRAMRVV